MSLYEIKCNIGGGYGHDGVIRVHGLLQNTNSSSIVLEFPPVLVEALSREMKLDPGEIANRLALSQKIKTSIVLKY